MTFARPVYKQKRPSLVSKFPFEHLRLFDVSFLKSVILLARSIQVPKCNCDRQARRTIIRNNYIVVPANVVFTHKLYPVNTMFFVICIFSRPTAQIAGPSRLRRGIVHCTKHTNRSDRSSRLDRLYIVYAE